jgi:hypothetical protein
MHGGLPKPPQPPPQLEPPLQLVPPLQPLPPPQATAFTVAFAELLLLLLLLSSVRTSPAVASLISNPAAE